MTPDLSIIVVTWNVEDLVVPCLRSVAEHAGELELEVFVVDNASSDGTVDRVRAEFPWVTVIANRANVGFPAANNQALARAHGRHVLFLNPDTVVGEGTLGACVRELDRDPALGMVGCRLDYPDGRVQYEGARRHYRLLYLVWEAFYLHEIFRGSRVFAHQLYGGWDHRGTRDVEAISGAFMVVRRRVALSVGGLPEEVFMSHEDLAFCLRVGARGHGVRYLGEVATVHFGGASRGRSTTPLDLLEGEIRVRLLRERGGPGALLARPAFAFRSAVRLAIALVARILPGLARLRAERPKAFAVRVHALHLLWSVAPRVAARFLPRAEPPDGAVVLPPRRTRPPQPARGL